MEDVTIVDAATTVRRRSGPGTLRLLVVTAGPLDTRPFLARAATRLRDAGWDVSVAAPERPRSDELAWYPLGGNRRARSRRLRHLGAFVDVVLVDPAALPLVQRTAPRAPVVLAVDEELLGPRSRVATDGVALAVATSEAAAAPLRWRGVETAVVAAPQSPAVEVPRREPANVIGCATRFDDAAGLDVLLDAFAALPRLDLDLELLELDGPADDRLVAALRARAARPDLDGRVVFVDSAADHRTVMRRWRVAVNANVGNGGSTVPLRDALALGVPVVVTDRGANVEVVDGHGLVVRPGRPTELAAALTRALDDAGPAGPGGNGSGNGTGNGTGNGAGRAAVATKPHAQLSDVLAAVAEQGARRNAGTIVFVVPDFEPTPGGTTRQTQNQARELQARGYDVLVLTQRLQVHWPRNEVRQGIRLRRVGPAGRTSLRMKMLVLSVAWWLRRHRDDIAVVNAIMYPDFVVSAELAGLGERTVMCWAGLGDATDTVGTSGALRAPLRAIRRHALSRAAQVALTPALHEELDRLGLGRDVSVIPTPVDIEHFRPPSERERESARRALGVEDDELVVVYTGHLRALKRVELLVEAFGLLVDSGRPARLFLVGSPRDDLDDRPFALHQELDRLSERDRVVVTGAVSDVRPYLHAADTFVLPSDREGLSNSVLEALASGLPVVAPASAAGDQVLDESCGIVPDSNDPSDLYSALTRLADDADYRRRLARGARQAAERFALSRVVNEYEGLYARLRRRGTTVR
jgi:glycosyltransferase involved in cell wall biosynthesis